MEETPAFDGMDDKLQLMPDGVREEIAQLLNPPDYLAAPAGSTHLLICRRNKYVYNSMCHEVSKTAKANPAFMHPDDIAELGGAEGDEVSLTSKFGTIKVIVASDSQLRRGVVSASHSFGSVVNGEAGKNFAMVSALLDTSYTNDPHARMPIMSAVPIAVELC